MEYRLVIKLQCISKLYVHNIAILYSNKAAYKLINKWEINIFALLLWNINTIHWRSFLSLRWLLCDSFNGVNKRRGLITSIRVEQRSCNGDHINTLWGGRCTVSNLVARFDSQHHLLHVFIYCLFSSHILTSKDH